MNAYIAMIDRSTEKYNRVDKKVDGGSNTKEKIYENCQKVFEWHVEKNEKFKHVEIDYRPWIENDNQGFLLAVQRMNIAKKLCFTAGQKPESAN